MDFSLFLFFKIEVNNIRHFVVLDPGKNFESDCRLWVKSLILILSMSSGLDFFISFLERIMVRKLSVIIVSADALIVNYMWGNFMIWL